MGCKPCTHMSSSRYRWYIIQFSVQVMYNEWSGNHTHFFRLKHSTKFRGWIHPSLPNLWRVNTLHRANLKEVNFSWKCIKNAQMVHYWESCYMDILTKIQTLMSVLTWQVKKVITDSLHDLCISSLVAKGQNTAKGWWHFSVLCPAL